MNDTYKILKTNPKIIGYINSKGKQYKSGLPDAQFLQDVKTRGISIVEGADVIAPDYVALRTGEDGYASTGEQLDMQYKDDGSWEAHILDVKTRFPKTNTGSTTIADVPSWVQEAADAVELQEI